MSERKSVYEYIDRNIDRHIGRLQEFLRQPSISPTGEGVRKCAELLRSYFDRLGCQKTEIVEPKYYSPIVYGEYDAGAKKTLIIYMMYDVQPPDPVEEWSVPPFEARLVKRPPFERVVMARGATNTKGSLASFVNAAESVKAVADELPVNLIFIAEGEEELGSVSLPQFIKDYTERLKKADGVFFPISVQDENSFARPHLGSEGITYIELETSGARWGRGPTEYGVHGGMKRILDSPAWRHVKMLSTLVSEDGNKVLVKGWYDNITVPTKEDLDLLKEGYRKSIPAVEAYDPELVKKESKAKVFIDDAEKPEDVLSKSLFSTILNLDGIWGGWTGAGTKTYLPHKATSKHSIRFVPKQNLNDLHTKIRKHLDTHGYKDVELRPLSGYTWSLGAYKSDIAEACYDMFEEFKTGYVLHPPVAPLANGMYPAWPAYLFTDPPLGLPLIGAALGHGGRAHAPDEYFVIDDYEGKFGTVYGLAGVEKGMVSILYNYAGRAKKRK